MTNPTTDPQASRPGIRNYGIHEQAEGMLPWSWVAERMAAARNYWVATVHPDGKPHATPVWGVWLDGMFYFATGKGSRKGRNLAANPHVTLNLESGDEVVIFEGRLEPVTDADLFERIAVDYHAKYDIKPEPAPDQVMYALRPSTVFGWLEQDYPRTATRWQFG